MVPEKQISTPMNFYLAVTSRKLHSHGAFVKKVVTKNQMVEARVIVMTQVAREEDITQLS